MRLKRIRSFLILMLASVCAVSAQTSPTSSDGRSRFSLSAFPSLEAAISSIGSKAALLEIDSNVSCTTPITVPSTVILNNAYARRISKSRKCTINFLGVGVERPESQSALFYGFAPGDVTFTGATYPTRISSNLWGNTEWSDQVNAATQSVKGKNVTIVTYPGNWTSIVRVYEGQSLYLTRGKYTDNTVNSGSNRFVLESNTSLYGDGKGQTIYQQSSLLNNARIVATSSLTDYIGLDGDNENIVVRGLSIEGRLTDPHVDTGASTIHLGNCRNCSATGIHLKNTNAYGIYCGAFPTKGFHASNCLIDRNIFEGVRGQNVGSTNGENVVVSNNVFTAIQPVPADGFISVVDFEPNAEGDIIDRVRVVNNTFDGRGAKQNWNAIVLQPAASLTGVRDCDVSNNTVIGGEAPDGTRRLSIGITLAGAAGCVVRDNKVNGTGQHGLWVNAVRNTTIARNTLTLVGGGGNPGIGIDGVSESVFDGNIISNRPQSASSSEIREREMTGTISANGVNVTRLSGMEFYKWMKGMYVKIADRPYSIAEVVDRNHLILSSPLGARSGLRISTISKNTYAGNKGELTLSGDGSSRARSSAELPVNDSFALLSKIIDLDRL